MKYTGALLFSLVFLACGYSTSFAQTMSARYHVAVFLPLYLDSAFDASGNYRFDQNFPKYISPGLEFYEGLELAMDSLEKAGSQLDVTIYDTRSAAKSLQQVLDEPVFDSTALIIGMVNLTELRLLSREARAKGIPFINVNFPNDGGITNNPQFVILNSTLKSHFEALYKFIQRNWATSNIIYLRRKGAQEDQIQNDFAEIERNTLSVPLHMKYVNIENPADPGQFLPYLDSNTKTIVLVGSLDENFGRQVCTQLASLYKTYKTKVFGMPTWDGIDFSGTEYTDEEIYYTTPFYSNPNDSLVSSIQQYFKTRFYSRPSDMVYRGYESMLHFGQLLADHQGRLNGSIGERKFKVFNDFDIQPVFLNKQNPTLDYLENKKLYYIKKVNGNVVAVY
ncbi:MAG: hypothetical protein Q8918_01710 [Bacteroidota bacterium]|nr:hypothetical protein [Bacteroidota bacterium]MDP4248805.1 hypothetical protein [Bacteroidota bacterium]